MGPLAGFGSSKWQASGLPVLRDDAFGMGADVIRVDRPSTIDLGVEMPRQFNVLNRGRRSIVLRSEDRARRRGR